MAFSATHFCCRPSGGSNLNAGTRTGNTTEPGTAADLTYASGSWVAATGVFTVASGDPVADGVAVGDFASVYADGSTVTGFVGRVTARTTTTITVSLTAVAGTPPTDGTNTRTLKIGGAWKGPNGAENFPFGFVASTLTNAAGDFPCVNLKNDATYSITSAITHSLIGVVTWRGYSSAFGDAGRAIIDGGTTGASYALLTVSAVGHHLRNLIFQNNGATGSATGVSITGATCQVTDCVFNSLRGTGLSLTGVNGKVSKSESYACNQSNTSNLAGFVTNDCALNRCIAHDNSGSNVDGFRDSSGGCKYSRCIADTNGRDGFATANTTDHSFISCDSYNNGRDGMRIVVSSGAFAYTAEIENCNFIKNGGYGINISGAGKIVGVIRTCGFGSGTQANTSGATTNLQAIEEISSVTYAADVTPWVDPADGDFRINLAAAQGTGDGAFLQTQSGYGDPNPTVAYPDIGAGQHLDAGSDSGAGAESLLLGGGGLIKVA